MSARDLINEELDPGFDKRLRDWLVAVHTRTNKNDKTPLIIHDYDIVTDLGRRRLNPEPLTMILKAMAGHSEVSHSSGPRAHLFLMPWQDNPTDEDVAKLSEMYHHIVSVVDEPVNLRYMSTLMRAAIKSKKPTSGVLSTPVRAYDFCVKNNTRRPDLEKLIGRDIGVACSYARHFKFRWPELETKLLRAVVSSKSSKKANTWAWSTSGREAEIARAVSYASTIGFEWPELEEVIVGLGKSTLPTTEILGVWVSWAKQTKRRLPSAEKLLLTNVDYALEYAAILEFRWPELEEKLAAGATNATTGNASYQGSRTLALMLRYASATMPDTWPELEKRILAGDGNASLYVGLEYAEKVKKGRWHELEKKIIDAKNVSAVFTYAKMTQMPFIEAERQPFMRSGHYDHLSATKRYWVWADNWREEHTNFAAELQNRLDEPTSPHPEPTPGVSGPVESLIS